MSRIEEIARGVAPLLDGSFRFNERAVATNANYWDGRHVINDDEQTGRQLYFSRERLKTDRVAVWGMLPNRRSCSVRITVSETRTVPAIAEDINRRFLPYFVKEWRTVFEQERARTDQLDMYRHQVNLIKGIVPNLHIPSHSRLEGNDEMYFQNGRLRMYARGHDSELSIRLPFDDLVRLFKFLFPEKGH